MIVASFMLYLAYAAATFGLRLFPKSVSQRSAEVVRIAAARRKLLIMQAAYLGLIGVLIWLGEHFSRGEPTETNGIYVLFVVTALAEAAALALINIKMIRQAEKKLRDDPNDANSFGRWRLGHMISFAICVAITLYGFVLRMSGWTFIAALPFYAGGIILLLFSSPRDRPSEEQETRTVNSSGER